MVDQALLPNVWRPVATAWGGRGKGEEGNLMGRGEGGGYITNGVHEKQKGGGYTRIRIMFSQIKRVSWTGDSYSVV